MFCVKCGATLPDGANFCPNCGAPANRAKGEPGKREVKTVQFRCKGCGHVMEIDPDSPVLHCPLCGSSELIQEDTEVTVERIRSRAKREEQQAYKEVQKGWQNIREKEIDADNEQETYEREKSEIHSYTHGKLFRITLVLVLVFGLFTARALSGKAYIATAIAVLQIILCLVSILLGLRTIRERGRGISTVLVVLAAVLFFPYITSYNARYDEDDKALVADGKQASLKEGITAILSQIEEGKSSDEESAVEKQSLFSTGLSTMLPQIEGTKVEYNTNSDKEADIDVEGVTYEQFDQYIADCQNMGYTANAVKETSEYTAYNADGYYLHLDHWNYSTKRLSIILKAPILGDPNFVWPESTISKELPVFENKGGIIKTDTDETLKVTICKVTTEDYDAYVSKCEQVGFTIDTDKNDKEFTAFNADGYEVTVSVGEMDTINITANAPREMTPLTWPTTGPATLIPKPNVTKGSIGNNYDWVYSVYLADNTIDDFNAYVDKCIAAGFDDDYTRYDTYFSADKGRNKDLTVEYTGFNTIYIRITDYAKF